ncbi:MAG: methyltransferase domain-containing protein [Acidimicrobiales bacterium]
MGRDHRVASLGAKASTSIARTTAPRFSVGNALSLSEPNGSFDAVRSERALQWIQSPEAAVTEMARVVRPGGLVSLIDTDWSTFGLDVGDESLAGRVREAMRTERGRPSNIGGRLPDLVQACGFDVVAQTASTQTWNAWNPDESPAPNGCFSMTSLADDVIERGHLALNDRERFVSTIHQAARDDRFSMTLTMFAIIAELPDAAG